MKSLRGINKYCKSYVYIKKTIIIISIIIIIIIIKKSLNDMSFLLVKLRRCLETICKAQPCVNVVITVRMSFCTCMQAECRRFPFYFFEEKVLLLKLTLII